MATSCPTCGFDPSSVSPADAVAALRSFPRRFRDLAAPPAGDDEGADTADAGDTAELESRSGTVAAEAGQAAEVIAAIGDDLRAVLVREEPTLGTQAGVATSLHNGGDPATALDRLAAATTSVADLAAAQPGEAWTRTGTRSTGAVSAIDLLREAVHAGAHHLHEARG